jgi:ribosomal protein L14E/L6E/L27E
VFLTIRGPYLLSGVPAERQKWERELTQRRLDEQSRIEDWEQHLKARRHHEKVRQDEWEQRQRVICRNEAQRREDWEQQLKARQHQERVRQDEWEQRQRVIRQDEAQRREQERLREDQWLREEEERQRLGLYWGELVTDSHCTAHNSREYRAQLQNTVTYDYNWLKPCEEIPIVIHGRSIKTTRCHINPSVSPLIE